MGDRLFIEDKTALEVIRRARVTGKLGRLRPSRVRELSGCAYRRKEISKIINGIDPDLRLVLPVDVGTDCKPLHVCVAHPDNRSMASGIVTHVHSGMIPAGTYLQLCENVFVLSAEGCFARLAPGLPVPKQVMLAMEVAGTYSFSPADKNYRFDLVQMTTIDKIASYCSKLPCAHGTNAEAALGSLRWAVQNSASPMETAVAMLLVLPYRYGGYGIEPPRMNVALDSAGNVVPTGTRGCRKPDLAWLDHRLALEYNGRESHNGLDDYARDSDRRDELEDLGMRVIPISAGKLYDVERFHKLACEVARITGKKLQLPQGFELKRDLLRSIVLPRRRRPNEPRPVRQKL